MGLKRREILVAGGAAAVGAAAVGAAVLATTGQAGDEAVPATPAPAFDATSWTSVRAQFALNPDVYNFTTFVFASHPAAVRDAIARHRAGLDDDPYGYLARNEFTLDKAVGTAAGQYLATDAGQIAFTDSTTMGLGLLYSGLRLAPGDEVLTTEHDFYSTHESLRLRRARDGAAVSRVRLYDEPEHADAGQIVARLVAAVRPRTRVVAITWVHSSTGVKLPVRAIADALEAINRNRPPAERALLCVDGVHGFGIEGTTPAELGCDFLVSGAHKWLFGPRGTGIIWGRPEAWARWTPVIPSFGGEPEAPPGVFATPGGYHSFEHRWALAEAFGFAAAVGPARIAARTHELATRLKAGLATLPKVRVRTPAAPELSAGIVCCEVEGYPPPNAVQGLRSARVLASATPYAVSYLRFGPSILTTESDVDAAIAATRAL